MRLHADRRLPHALPEGWSRGYFCELTAIDDHKDDDMPSKCGDPARSDLNGWTGVWPHHGAGLIRWQCLVPRSEVQVQGPGLRTSLPCSPEIGLGASSACQ